MKFERSSGLLLHPTSLPGPYGVGDLGAQARGWIDFLVTSGQTYWQILPLCPPGFGNSPYQGFSAFAGNPLLISPDGLQAQGWVTADEVKQLRVEPSDRVDFERLIPLRQGLLRKAFQKFQQQRTSQQHTAFESFCQANQDWLHDYALFMAIKDDQTDRPWIEWSLPLAQHEPDALREFGCVHQTEVEFHQFVQWVFATQWQELKTYANQHHVKLIGDAPIFVAYDSADVWSNRQLFQLEETGEPIAVAGVPPDYFSATGQLWGNPLYAWEVMAEDEYQWWIRRFEKNLEMVDVIRLDHFRGFEKYWWIPADAETAEPGHWEEGPGYALFDKLRDHFGSLPLIAEDLGLITPEVHQLREHYGLPGMRVLQFAFGGDPKVHPYLPHNYTPNSVVYTGTHDNDTTFGWFHEYHELTNTMPLEEWDRMRHQVLTYLGTDGSQIHWDLVRLAMTSPALLAVVPVQDLLGLGAAARMNLPGTIGPQNWSWRLANSNLLNDAISEYLSSLVSVTGRERVVPVSEEQETTNQQ